MQNETVKPEEKPIEEVDATDATETETTDLNPEEPELDADKAEGSEESGTKGSEDDDAPLTLELDEDAEDDADDDEANPQIKQMRERLREINRENRELKAKAAKAETVQDEKPAELGKKPSLEDDDIDYDEDLYDAALIKWNKEKRDFDKRQEEQKKKAEAQDARWNERLSAFEKQREDLSTRSDYHGAKDLVNEHLTPVQQGIIVNCAGNAAHLLLALGKNPARLKRLSAIEDPVEFAYEVAKEETKMKVTGRKAPAPEQRVTHGSGAPASTIEKQIDAAREAGDITKVMALKRSQNK